jgi:hypothetical protein
MSERIVQNAREKGLTVSGETVHSRSLLCRYREVGDASALGLGAE